MLGQIVPLATPLTGRGVATSDGLRDARSGLLLLRGQCRPLGATVRSDGVNFAVFSRHAQAVSLVLFEEGAEDPFAELPLDPVHNRTGDIWHIFVRNLRPGVLYGYRANGPFDPRQGHRFNPRTIVLDPYARALSGGYPWGVRHESRNRPARLGKVVQDDFDWGDDTPPNTPLSQTVIYEMHVRGFTRHPSSGVQYPGSFLGLVEKLPHLKALGVTAVQLMPALEFDETDVPGRHPGSGAPLVNYWGYSPLSFFAPKSAYASRPGQQLRDFKEMVRQFHLAGIEVILDVVYNHTCEGNENGPTLGFRGLDNSIYYMLDREGRYYNFSGCGNTFNCNHPIVRDLILDSLVELVAEYHVDGFRFDLAAILGRGANGKPLDEPTVIQHIAEHPVLANTKLIAEAWDAGGLNLVGKFPTWGRWAEFNGHFRDDVRRWLRSEPGCTAAVAKRITGSLDIYGSVASHPYHSINFVTCHDGFTLADLVTYSKKHNWANGENNRDGWDDSLGYNCGHEGPTDNPHILALRQRQLRNYFVLVFLSQGVPLILMGDEFARTQQGNNNAYCQDNEISWVDWNLAQKHSGLVRFVSMMIALRKRYFSMGRDQFLARVHWHGSRLGDPDWTGHARTLALHLTHAPGQPNFYFLFNSHWEPHRFQLPPIDGHHRWRRLADTNLPSPDDIVEEHNAVPLNPGDHYIVSPRSTVILIG
ncbi:MAG: glycogen debranching protein GlgX [Gemmataceae bacterium]